MPKLWNEIGSAAEPLEPLNTVTVTEVGSPTRTVLSPSSEPLAGNCAGDSENVSGDTRPLQVSGTLVTFEPVPLLVTLRLNVPAADPTLCGVHVSPYSTLAPPGDRVPGPAGAPCRTPTPQSRCRARTRPLQGRR